MASKRKIHDFFSGNKSNLTVCSSESMSKKTAPDLCRIRGIKAAWFSRFTWLHLDKKNQLFKCEVCVTKFSKCDDFTKHEKSKDHREAVLSVLSADKGELQRGDYLSIVKCTACAEQIYTGNPGAACKHPVLEVLVCERCYKFYKSGEFSQDSNGIDDQCRWCGEGGNLYCCDFCSNAFCKGCIRRNLGRSELSQVMDSGEDTKWHCYVCNPRPLSAVREDCNRVFEEIAKKKKRKESRTSREESERSDMTARL